MKITSLFPTQVELNNNWIAAHKDHSLCWMNHTVYDQKEKVGRKFKECICYTCSQVARELLSEVGEASASPKSTEKKPARYNKAKPKKQRYTEI